MANVQRHGRPDVLDDHVRRGRRYISRLASLDGFIANDWIRDDAPDLLWPLLLVGLDGASGSIAFGRFQESAVDALADETTQAGTVVLDGRLTSLERVPTEHRAAIIELVRADDRVELLPDLVLAALGLYEDPPGGWLLVDPWPRPEVPIETVLQTVADALVSVATDRHLNALVKCAPFGWELATGRLHLPRELAHDLVDYPAVEEHRGKADAFILSSFLAQKAMEEETDPTLRDARVQWSRRFWNSNWQLSECILETDLTEGEDPDNSTGGNSAKGQTTSDQAAADVPADWQARFQESIERLDRVVADLEEAVFDRSHSPDLYEPARHEVLAGLGMRACRSVTAMFRAAHMWTGEHASAVMRSLAESIIVIKWLTSQGSDEVFHRYQDYGHGKRKLQLRHMRSSADEMEDESEFLSSLIDEVGRRAGGEWAQELQEVNVESTFSGRSLRDMAHEVGERDLYNHLFQQASGVAHGEWWALEDYAMQRCLNPLHRFHWVPEFRWGSPTPDPRFPELLLTILEGIVAQVAEGIRA